MTRIRHAGLGLWILLVVGLGPASADAPVEDYHLPYERIPAAVLTESRGALTIMCQDPDAMRKYHGKTVPEVVIRSYRRDGTSFVQAGTIPLRETRPLTGWLFDATRVRRFPSVVRKGEYVRIVYNVDKDLRARVRPKEFSDLMPKGWGDSASPDWFSGGVLPNRPVVDIWYLCKDKKRRLYDAPIETACSVVVTRQSLHKRLEAERLDGNPVITEVRGGFGLLGSFDPCSGQLKRFKWIRVRDDKGRLTIWPVVGLSC